MKKLRGLYQRGETWWLTWRVNGKKRFLSLQTKDYAEAVRLAVTAKRTDKGSPAGSIAAERERFLASKRQTGLYARHSAEWAETPLKQLESFCGNVAVSMVTGAKLERFAEHLRDDRKLAETSVASYMRAVRSFFSWLHKRGDVPINPASKMTLPKVTQSARVEFCSKELRDRLIAEAPDNDMRLILMLGFHAGLRKNEIIEARPEWICGDGIHIEKTATFRPKDRERRAVPMTAALSAFLTALDKPSPFLLRPEVKHGAALYRYDFRAPFESYMKAQGCPWVTPHTMRRTFASLLVSAGVSIYKVARWLGDGVAVAEKHYGHLVVADSDIERSG